MARVVIRGLPHKAEVREREVDLRGAAQAGTQDEVGLAGVTAAVVVDVGPHQDIIEAIAIHVAGA